jgi:toluene monooxygenase system ferredoxin subunit
MTAAGWRPAMPFDDLWIGDAVGIELAGVPVLLVNIDDEVRAYVDSCPHQGSRLSDGDLAGRELTCATHQWQFDALTGHGINPAGSRMTELPVRVEDGVIEVMIDAGRPELLRGVRR